MKMTVNINNLRRQALYSYDRLCEKLNDRTDENGEITIDVLDIQGDMDDLRRLIFSFACCYIEGDDDFKDVSEEVGKIAYFNYDEDTE